MSDNAGADTSTTEIGLADAAKLIEATLDPKPRASAPEKAQQPPEGDAQPEIEAEDGAETPEEGTEPEPEGPDEATDDADDAEEGEGDEQPQLFTVKIDGKEEQVPADELVRGYQRQSDYTRKTQALAEERKSFLEEQRQVKVEREQYAAILPQLRETLRASAPQQPDPSLLYTDPAEFQRQQFLWGQHMAREAAIADEESRIGEQTRKEREQEATKAVEEGREYLLTAVPEWKDPKRFEADKAKLRDYAVNVMGASPEEIAAITNPKVVLLLRKAMLFDGMSRTPPKPVAPRGPRTAEPASVATAPRPASEAVRAQKRLARTGSVEDAAAVIARIL